MRDSRGTEKEENGIRRFRELDVGQRYGSIGENVPAEVVHMYVFYKSANPDKSDVQV